MELFITCQRLSPHRGPQSCRALPSHPKERRAEIPSGAARKDHAGAECSPMPLCGRLGHLGRTTVERHFVDDRTFPHTDASASLEPDGMRRLCRDLKAIQKVFANKNKISQEELEQRNKLRVCDDKSTTS